MCVSYTIFPLSVDSINVLSEFQNTRCATGDGEAQFFSRLAIVNRRNSGAGVTSYP